MDYLPRLWDADAESWRTYDDDLKPYVIKQQNRIKDVADFTIADVGAYSVYSLAYTPSENL